MSRLPLGFLGGFVSKEKVRRFEAEPLLLSLLLTVETSIGGFDPLKWSPVTVKLSMFTSIKKLLAAGLWLRLRLTVRNASSRTQASASSSSLTLMVKPSSWNFT